MQYPNYEAQGYYYKNVFAAPGTLNGDEVDVEAFQPGKQAKHLIAARWLRTDDEIRKFSKNVIVDDAIA